MKMLNLVTLFIVCLTVNAQNTDKIIKFEGDTIIGEITKIDKKRITIKKKDSEKKISLEDIYDIELNSNPEIVLKYKRKIPKPKSGKALIIFYRVPNIVNSAVGLKLLYNDKKLTRISNNSYFIHEVNPGKHKYSSKAWLNKFDGIELEVKADEIYFIHIEQTSKPFNSVYVGNTVFYSGGINFSVYPRTLTMGKLFWNNIKKQVK